MKGIWKCRKAMIIIGDPFIIEETGKEELGAYTEKLEREITTV